MGFKVRHSERELCSSVEGWGHLGMLSLLEGMGAQLQGSEPRAPLQTGTRTTDSRRPTAALPPARIGQSSSSSPPAPHQVPLLTETSLAQIFYNQEHS